jgi:hypothetical protein
VYQHNENPSWGAVKLMQLANQYAEEFLLRGDNRSYGEPVGGQISMSVGSVKALKLQPAVRTGLLLIA